MLSCTITLSSSIDDGIWTANYVNLECGSSGGFNGCGCPLHSFTVYKLHKPCPVQQSLIFQYHLQ